MWYIYTNVHIDTFQVLSDPNRLQIVELLRDNERAVNDLVARMEIHQSGVSRHLRILEDAGFVEMRAAGNKRLYSLRPDRFREMDDWLNRYRALWTARLDAFGEALQRKQQQRARKRPRSK